MSRREREPPRTPPRQSSSSRRNDPFHTPPHGGRSNSSRYASSSLPPSSPRSPRSSPRSPSTLSPVMRHEIARYKRIIEELRETVQSLKAEKRARTVTAKTMGRPVRKLVAMFGTVPSLVHEHDRREEGDLPEEIEDLTEEELQLLSEDEINERNEKIVDKRERDRNETAYQLLVKAVPGLQKKLEDPNQAPEEIVKYLRELETGGNNARNDDVNTSKEEIVAWLEARPVPPSPRLNKRTRLFRAFSNDTTGALICPADMDWNDPAVKVQLRENQVSLSLSPYAFYLPVFYRNEQVDINDVENGYLMGDLIVKMFRMVFTSPGSVDEFPVGETDPATVSPSKKRTRRVKNSRQSTKKNVAQIVGLKAPTPRSIAYCAVLLRFALSDAQAWGADRSFNYEGLYYSIVDYFEEADPSTEEGQRVKELLVWWKRQIFSDAEGNASTSSKPLQGHKATLDAQRRARREAEAAGAAQTAAASATASNAAGGSNAS
ncbi:hypothetical protein V5O48_017440 [Marasmius crinis-equi]|uniref:Uncharacterized protein n=1 Tax=Marasmius crinis-equi TaxID=585013 RepID=A0ABR3ENX5_9AGAR